MKKLIFILSIICINIHLITSLACYQAEPLSTGVNTTTGFFPTNCSSPDAQSCSISHDKETSLTTYACESYACKFSCRELPPSMTKSNTTIEYCCCADDGCNTTPREITEKYIAKMYAERERYIPNGKEINCFKDEISLGTDVRGEPSMCPHSFRACMRAVDYSLFKVTLGCARICQTENETKGQTFCQHIKNLNFTYCCCFGNGCNGEKLEFKQRRSENVSYPH